MARISTKRFEQRLRFYFPVLRSPRVIFPRQNKQQPDPDANRAVGDVEGGKTGFRTAARAKIKSEKIHHVPEKQAVAEIAENAAEHEAERDLAPGGFGVEMVAPDEQG